MRTMWAIFGLVSTDDCRFAGSASASPVHMIYLGAHGWGAGLFRRLLLSYTNQCLRGIRRGNI